jgi:hypothetical protein
MTTTTNNNNNNNCGLSSVTCRANRNIFEENLDLHISRISARTTPGHISRTLFELRVAEVDYVDIVATKDPVTKAVLYYSAFIRLVCWNPEGYPAQEFDEKKIFKIYLGRYGSDSAEKYWVLYPNKNPLPRSRVNTHQLAASTEKLFDNVEQLTATVASQQTQIDELKLSLKQCEENFAAKIAEMMQIFDKEFKVAPEIEPVTVEAAVVTAVVEDDIFDCQLPQMKRETTIESDMFIDDLLSGMEIPMFRYQESGTLPFLHQKMTPYNSGPHPHDDEVKKYVGHSYRGYIEPQAMTRGVTHSISDENPPAIGQLSRCVTISMPPIDVESQSNVVPFRRLVSSTVTPSIIENVYETVDVDVNPFKRTHTYDSPAWVASNPPIAPVEPAPLGMKRGVTYWNPLGIRREDELKYREESNQEGYDTP